MNITFYRHSPLGAMLGVDPATHAIESNEWWLRHHGKLPRPEWASLAECLKIAKSRIKNAKRFSCPRKR